VLLTRTATTTPRPAVRRTLGRALVGVLAVILTVSAWVVVPALSAPGNDDLPARVAESARDRGLGFVVTGLETLQYQLSPPPEKGSLDPAAVTSLAAAGTGPSPLPTGAERPAHDVGRQLDIAPLAAPALPGEGVFTTRVSVDGQPALQTAQLRPDAVHTSFLAGVAWMSSSLLRFVQHPGATDPGRLSQWQQPATVPTTGRAGLAATFNSGFKIADSRGAYYQDGATIGRFRAGTASLVIYRDGHADIGAWGREVTMTPDVVSVRQNLSLLVDGGRLNPTADTSSQSDWGATIGSAAYVWRSGIGVTARGDLVFVMGDALSAGSLGNLLQRAGAVRAMQLDINRSWVSFMWYSPGPAVGTATPHKLIDFSRPADRYFTVNNRDFFAVYTR